MADRDKEDQVTAEIQQRSAVREILQAGAKEMGFAVNSIRQEVVEKGWFGDKVTPTLMQDADKDKPIAGAQDFSRDDLYGRDPDGPDEVSRDDFYRCSPENAPDHER